MSIFKGSCVALATPFQQSGVNYETLEKLLEFQLANGTDAILVCGTTGEPSTMSPEEKFGVIDFTVKKVNGQIPVIAGAGSNCTASSVEATKRCLDLGVDAVLAVTPYYNKCSRAGLIQHFTKIADVGLPVILYNVPSRTGFNITPDALRELADHPNIAAIKEASANITQIVEMARTCLGKIDIYSGNDDHVVPVMSVGGLGVISVTANIAPREVHEMAQQYLDGNLKNAQILQFQLNPLSQALFSEVNPIPVKTALRLMGYDMGELRLPLCEMTEANLARLKKEMAALGLLR